MIDLNEMSVLIVDDEPNMCKTVRSMLKVLEYGKRFHYAHNGAEALKLIKTEPVDLAIVDWNMPIMTGVEFLGNLREDRNLRDTPVIMVTAEANREIVAEAAESDIDAYILKPLTTKSLADRIVGVVKKANDPPPMVCHLKSARDFEEAGDFDAAIGEVNKAIEADPSSSKPVRELGYLFLKKNDIDKAEKYLLKAAEMNDLDVFSCHHLGELYLTKNDIEKASLYFDRAMQISPRHVSRAVNFGKVLVQKNITQKAIKVFNKAMQLSDNSLGMSEEIADFCLENGLYAYSINLFDFVLKTIPTRYDIMCKLAAAYENLGQYQHALGHLLQAEKKNGEDIEIKIRLARIYIHLNQMIRAERILNAVLKLNPGHEEASQLLRQTA